MKERTIVALARDLSTIQSQNLHLQLGPRLIGRNYYFTDWAAGRIVQNIHPFPRSYDVHQMAVRILGRVFDIGVYLISITYPLVTILDD